jgi:hypothetical protein
MEPAIFIKRIKGCNTNAWRLYRKTIIDIDITVNPAIRIWVLEKSSKKGSLSKGGNTGTGIDFKEDPCVELPCGK